MAEDKTYYDADADPGALAGKTIAILGYGSQGHAHALNLKESGHDVVVGLRARLVQPRAGRGGGARGARHPPTPPAAATSSWSCCPTRSRPRSGSPEIRDGIAAGDLLMFAHGFAIHFGQIEPPPGVDVGMVAPKGPGHLVRRQYQEGKGVPCLMAVHQDETGNARELVLAYASGIGGGRAGVIETTFKDECETDLFGEQAVLCGGATELVRAGLRDPGRGRLRPAARLLRDACTS